MAEPAAGADRVHAVRTGDTLRAPARLLQERGRGRVCGAVHDITFDCTDEMRRSSPAAVHVDGTARPQLVTADTNPSFHGC